MKTLQQRAVAEIEESARRLERRRAGLMRIDEIPLNETTNRLDAVVALLLRECPLADLLRAVRETEGQ